MLSNLETPQSKLLQIVLIGQPEIRLRLERPDLVQLRQRIELRHEIRPLVARETAEYVRERLLIAGHESGDLFTERCLKRLHELSGGVPRVINVLCDNALLIAFASGSNRVSHRLLEEAARDVGVLAGSEAAPLEGAGAGATGRKTGWLRRWWPGRSAAHVLGL